MKTFSNRNYLRLLSPQNSATSYQTVMLLGISLAGVSLVTIALWMNYRRQKVMFNTFKKQNVDLLQELEANKLPYAMPGGIEINEELDQDPDN